MAKYTKMKLSEARAKFEQIDELSKNTVKSYYNKAGEQGREIMGKMFVGGGDHSKDGKDTKTLYKRGIGRKMALKRRSGEVKMSEDVEQIDELSKDTLKSYRDNAMSAANAGGGDWSEKTKQKTAAGLLLAKKKLAGKAKVNATEEVENVDESMTDASMGGADNIGTSKTGEVYKKTNEKSTAPAVATGTATHVVAKKDGEAYNTTGITKRVPALESAVLDVMAKSLEKRKIFEDAENIAIISPEQRQDWLEVSKGNMDVVDYFNKYKV